MSVTAKVAYICFGLVIIVCAAIAIAALVSADPQDVLGSFSTDLAPRTAEQRHNIARAASRIEGQTIKPGEEFSFNRTVGPCGVEQGYQQAGTIVDGEIRAEWGGGVCQLSSTLYNAVLLAGLRVTQRQPHSRPASSVPPGRDAAIAFGIADLRFVNNSEYAIKLQAKVTSNRLTVSILGTTPRPRVRIAIETQTVPAQSYGAPRYGPGGQPVLDRSRQGDVVMTYRTTTPEGGEPRRELISRDEYEVAR